MEERVRKRNTAEVRPGGQYVLYWCSRGRRAEWNHALEFAIRLANERRLPLLVFESLSCDYAEANARLHTFALQGVPEFAAALRRRGIGYCFHLPRRKGEAIPIAAPLAAEAAAIVTDDHPLERPAADCGDAAWYAVDASCIVPAHSIPQRAYAAYSLRPKIRKLLPQFLLPVKQERVKHRFTLPLPAFHTEVCAENVARLVAECEIDPSVTPVAATPGGRGAALHRLARFLEHGLRRYAREKNEPSAHATSGLSPYLRAGYISSLEVAMAVQQVAAEHRWIAGEFLEELIVRRELAFNFAWHARRLDSLRELPEWAQATLRKHRRDRRDPAYNGRQFAAARTHDDLWNAAQRELLLRGTIHGYYRMYWGKKILEWSRTPQEALATMIHLHDRYALDGQDPNTYANILWCFGLHDRPWPERPVYGTVRSMSRAGMERKTNVAAYLEEIARLEQSGGETA